MRGKIQDRDGRRVPHVRLSPQCATLTLRGGLQYVRQENRQYHHTSCFSCTCYSDKHDSTYVRTYRRTYQNRSPCEGAIPPLLLQDELAEGGGLQKKRIDMDSHDLTVKDLFSFATDNDVN